MEFFLSLNSDSGVAGLTRAEGELEEKRQRERKKG
jgi:hypothetical protein